MKVYQARPNSGLFLGRQGENSARQIRFDVSEWERLYGVGVVQLIVQRHGEDTPYPVALSMDGSEAVWTVSSADTAISGRDGKAELQYYVGDTLAKSCTWDTLVIEALGEPSEEPPEAHAGWVEQVLSVASTAVKAQEAAAKSEQNAAASAKTATEKAATVGSAFVAAQGFASQAKQAATQAEQSAEEAAAAAAEAKEAAKEGASEMAEEAKAIAEQAKAVAEEAAAAAEEAKAAADGAAGAAKEAEEATVLAMLAGHAALIAGNGASTHSLGEMYVKAVTDGIEGNLVRISGKTPSMADLENGFSFAFSSEDIDSWVGRAPVSGLAVETLEVPPKLLAEGLFDEVVVAVDDNLTMIFDGAAFIVRQDNYTIGSITFPTKGVYVLPFVASFRVNGFSFDEGGASSWNDLEDKPFEEIGGDTLTWDGNTEGLTGVYFGGGGGIDQWFYLVSDATPSVDDLANGGRLHASSKYSDGPWENDEEFTSANVAGVDGLIVIDGIVFIVGAEAVGVVIEGLGAEGVVFPQEGTYLPYSLIEDKGYSYISSLTIPGYTGFTTERLKESCLPATVPVVQSAAVGQTIVVKAVDEDGKPTEWEATDPMVLASSTEGSTKKFKITVDDLGTLTATEITEE